MGIIGFIIILIKRSIRGGNNKRILNNTIIEIIWTIIPTIIIIIIGIPAIKLLYKIEEIKESGLTVGINGRQWYWEYKIKEIEENYESYNKEGSKLRLKEVDKPLYLPINIPIRIIGTSGDVIHSWGINKLGIKMDVNPGRLNTCNINLIEEGKYFGHCYELCGRLHSKMPIEVRGIKIKKWIEWVIGKKEISLEIFKNIITLIK